MLFSCVYFTFCPLRRRAKCHLWHQPVPGYISLIQEVIKTAKPKQLLLLLGLEPKSKRHLSKFQGHLLLQHNKVASHTVIKHQVIIQQAGSRSRTCLECSYPEVFCKLPFNSSEESDASTLEKYESISFQRVLTQCFIL